MEWGIGQARYSRDKGSNLIHSINIVVDYNSYISTQTGENHHSNYSPLSSLFAQVTEVEILMSLEEYR